MPEVPDDEPMQVEIRGAAPPPRSASDVVLPREVLNAAPHQTGGDLLEVVPGIYVTQHSGEGKAYQIFYRGFDAVHGQDLEIWAGGVPVNDVSNVHGQGYADLHFVMPEVVRQVHALPGTYDPRQGDFAVAGTLRLGLGYAEPGFTAKGSLGQFGTRRAFLAYHPADEPEETFAAFELYSTEGFGPSRAARRASLVAQSMHPLPQGASLRLLGSTYAGRFDSAGVVLLRDIERGSLDRFGAYDPGQGGASTRTQVLVEASRAREDERWSVAPYLVVRSLELESNFTGYLADPAEGDAQQQSHRAITLGVTGSFRRNVELFAPSDAIEIGVMGRNDAIAQSQRRRAAVSGQTTRTQIDADVRAVNAAGYLDLALHPIQRIAVRGGLRLDGVFYETEDRAGAAGGEVRSSQGAHVGKRGSVEVSLLRGLNAVASYGEGFRSPQARSLADGQETPFTTVTSTEAGLRYADHAVRASAALFHTRLSDDLVFDQATARNERVPATTRTGAAAELIALPARWFTSSFSATYARATFRGEGGGYAEGALVPYVPQLIVRSDLAFTPRLGTLLGRAVDLHLGAGMTGQLVRPLPYNERGHDVFLVDASARLRLREIELRLDVWNLFDAAWFDGEFTYASNFHRGAAPSLVPLRHVTVGPPLSILGSLAVYI